MSPFTFYYYVLGSHQMALQAVFSVMPGLPKVSSGNMEIAKVECFTGVMSPSRVKALKFNAMLS